MRPTNRSSGSSLKRCNTADTRTSRIRSSRQRGQAAVNGVSGGKRTREIQVDLNQAQQFVTSPLVIPIPGRLMKSRGHHAVGPYFL